MFVAFGRLGHGVGELGNTLNWSFTMPHMLRLELPNYRVRSGLT